MADAVASCHDSPAPPPRDGAPSVALVGSPNAGKSTLFNALTGAGRAVGNYPGTTVEVGRGRWRNPAFGRGSTSLNLAIRQTPSIFTNLKLVLIVALSNSTRHSTLVVVWLGDSWAQVMLSTRWKLPSAR